MSGPPSNKYLADTSQMELCGRIFSQGISNIQAFGDFDGGIFKGWVLCDLLGGAGYRTAVGVFAVCVWILCPGSPLSADRRSRDHNVRI